MKGLVFTALFFINASGQVNEMFDDFTYSGPTDTALVSFGWEVKSGDGGPGAPGCKWSKEHVSFIDDTMLAGNKLLQLTATTYGSGATSVQAEVFHKQIYHEGTYAARIYFTDSPINGGVDGDQINETFFAISPLAFNMDSNYSELDFVEYLANGGWGVSGNTFWMTSWESYQLEPWVQDSKSDNMQQSFEGWHTVACVVANGQIKYYIDGELKATHTGKYYPESLMSINFNLWFLKDGFVSSTEKRTYIQQIDWVYHAKNTVISPVELPGIVDKFRKQSIARKFNITL